MTAAHPCSKYFVVLLAGFASTVSACSSNEDLPARVERGETVEPTEPEKPSPATSDSPSSGTTTPVVAPPLGGVVGQWTWFDVPGATCANGSPTGVGVNLGTSTELLVFFEGGGACWDEGSCFKSPTATHIEDGYTKETFESELAGILKSDTEVGVLSRTFEKNPFKSASIVYVPYCTGDVHAGDAEATFGNATVHFVGRRNVGRLLDELVPAFQGVTHVTVAGRSAGGFGAAFNYWRIADRFRDARVDLVDDSGPPFEQWAMPLYPTWKSAWKLDPAIPAGCTACKTNIAEITPYYAKTYPRGRFALLSYDQDPTISAFFLTLPVFFALNLYGLTTNRIKPLPNARYFVPSGSVHTMLGTLYIEARGVDLGTWLGNMSKDEGWTNVSVQQ